LVEHLLLKVTSCSLRKLLSLCRNPLLLSSGETYLKSNDSAVWLSNRSSSPQTATVWDSRPHRGEYKKYCPLSVTLSGRKVPTFRWDMRCIVRVLIFRLCKWKCPFPAELSIIQHGVTCQETVVFLFAATGTSSHMPSRGLFCSYRVSNPTAHIYPIKMGHGSENCNFIRCRFKSPFGQLFLCSQFAPKCLQEHEHCNASNKVPVHLSESG
jgi:hypothetical protein